MLSAMGGWRGVVESILPGLVYLACVILVGELLSGPDHVYRDRRRVHPRAARAAPDGRPALASLVGVGVCALFRTGGRSGIKLYVPDS
ncbi:hypothetical protein QJS66_04835 [Kocuria rhizophila]|nr:hypothetical protein QJS66_04835 [Kocuria rhizophila]